MVGKRGLGFCQTFADDVILSAYHRYTANGSDADGIGEAMAYLSVEAYLAGERASEIRHEYVDGVVWIAAHSAAICW